MADNHNSLDMMLMGMSSSMHSTSSNKDSQAMYRSTSGGVATREASRSALDFSNLEIGEESPKDLEFCPFKLIRQYPHNYVGNGNQAYVISFFNATLFEERSWDIFCLSDPGPNGRDPLLLVPSAQFEEYLKHANSALDIQLSIPRGDARRMFFITFGESGTPVPRFVGQIDSDEALEGLKLRAYKIPKDKLMNLTLTVLRNYRDKIDKIYESFKSRKNRRNLEMAKLKRIERQKGYSRTAKRAQRYLGLRGDAAYGSASRILVAGWNENMPAPFKTREPVRFICVDIEAWEKAPNVVTEVGLAVLDTKDTVGIPPGRNGQGWFQLMKCYHFIIREHKGKVNRRYVKGCPDSFGFGDSEIVRMKDIGRAVGAIIGDNESEDRRPVIMVGHSIGQDLNYLRKVGYNIWGVRHFSDEIDTQMMFQRLEKSPNVRGLAVVCDELEIPGENFHNAGNDAAYTLRAMVTMAVKLIAGSKGGQMEKANHLEDSEWSDGDMDDGGAPQRSLEPIREAF
ncbi:hypothetical protein AAE478_003830 [Parahypoxylon ruwenzoriense]